jgi:Na+-transporting NADH:ubiquinone oxidoreductase subunit NqrB
MSSDTDALLRQIRRWLLVIAFLLGVGILTVAHTGYILTVTSLLYWQRLVFSAAGVIGGVIAFIAGIKILGSLVSPE